MQITEKRKLYLRMLLVSGTALLARLLFLGGKSFWIDECLAWGAVRLSWLEMFQSVASGTPHPPIAFLIMKISSLIAGQTEFGLRFLVAVVVASASIPVFRLASRRTTETGGFWAAMVWAVSPFAVSIGQEAWVYGVNLAISLWFADSADMAWRGSKKGYTLSIILGIAGILTQHIFILSIASVTILYFTIEKKISFKRFILLPGILVLLYIPVFLFFSAQFAERSSRMLNAGFHSGFSRLFTLIPLSRFFQILAGGILPDITRNLLDRPRMLMAYTLNSLVILALAVWPYFTRMLKLPERKYLWLCLLMPFALFLTDDPTVRQLAILWIPFSITSAAVFSRYHRLGAAVFILCIVALIPYYRMSVFPYHRSDWRAAVEEVEYSSEPGDIVVLFGGKSTSLAWEFYSETEMICLTPAGEQPFAEDMMRTPVNPELFLDSLLAEGEHDSVWVILDIWGDPSVNSIKGRHVIEYSHKLGEKLEVALLRRSLL